MFIPRAAVADYAPENTYLVCGNYLVAIEATWRQRIANKLGSKDYSAVNFDLRILQNGERASHLKADREATAYRDSISFTAYGVGETMRDRIDQRYRINRVDGTLSVARWRGEFSEPWTCSTSSKNELRRLIEAHNSSVGELRF